ncbi:MAG: RtcB family protein [Clostridiales bacterium]|nr:RtcB family protein [Clostridiales bacterium]
MKDLKIFSPTVAPGALNQIYTILSQPAFKGQRVRIMPDVHAGIGCVVGFTSTFSDKIVPNVIGVDIGCGMLTCEMGNIDIDFAELDKFIKNNIPAGSAVHKRSRGEDLINSLYCKNQLTDMPRILGSIGSLGGGNHFIEVDADEDGAKYLVVHTGSRNLGKQVCNIYQKLAVHNCKTASLEDRNKIIEEYKASGRQAEIPDALIKLTEQFSEQSKTPDHLCFLQANDMQKYLHDMRICQVFAQRNREDIAESILKFLKVFRFKIFETIHNFIGEDNIIRKGAIPAHMGERVLIPMNMRDGCIIAEGLGNDDWNNSAPHGAGRLLSRGDAKKLLTEEEYLSQMQGIYTTTANLSTIDESPMAYKPMQEILSLISPTVKILKIIKPLYNFKSAE